MSGKNILSLIMAIGVGILAFWLIKTIFSLVFALTGWLIAGAIIGGVGYLAYRKFNSMLSSGKRLT